ncbi:hypothetical protein D9757_014065 [Collybiopsis confluens]|uniref:PUM-HD domain-containing protein n=1 Tax=Collybiopsis confluens TaxID=2823264 RepID=A0A8H5CQ70_9AGAR|nr:hypothetical protein D9757_014065 [Collybiopsis confluens]
MCPYMLMEYAPLRDFPNIAQNNKNYGNDRIVDLIPILGSPSTSRTPVQRDSGASLELRTRTYRTFSCAHCLRGQDSVLPPRYSPVGFVSVIHHPTHSAQFKMSIPTQNLTPPADHTPPSDNRKRSPPAFLDHADSRVELKRLEHERQRTIQRNSFENQKCALEQQQTQELLSLPLEPNNSGIQHLTVSASTTPSQMNGVLQTAMHPGAKYLSGSVKSNKAVGPAGKRNAVTYGPSIHLSLALSAIAPTNFARSAGAKSMPASRRTAANIHELAHHLQGLSLEGKHPWKTLPVPTMVSASVLTRDSQYTDDEGARYASTYNEGMMLDEQLDRDMHNAMRHLPAFDEDKYPNSYANKVSTSSAALNFAHISQRSNNHSPQGQDVSSDRPQVSLPDRIPPAKPKKCSLTNPRLTPISEEQTGLGTVSPSTAPLIAPHLQGVSPPPFPCHGSLLGLLGTSWSVPATFPASLGLPSDHVVKTPSDTLPDDTVGLNGRPLTWGSHLHDSISDVRVQASLFHVPSSRYENNPLRLGEIHDEPYSAEEHRGLANGDPYSANNTIGSTTLHRHDHSRYGLGLPGCATTRVDGKMNGVKRKCGDMDFDRFAGTCLEDLAGEIPALCKNLHGCRYLQQKLKEGVPEHRDMIFQETFGHFTDLMTGEVPLRLSFPAVLTLLPDPFGNYLCQKLLEYSTDDQRNMICEYVTQDLVSISLNVHGTRAVQKAIDFLSAPKQQAVMRYKSQIHSITVALSFHVLVLIKDVNGNHVIQKCLNKLSQEDNQFIYNAVTANCVEVATHRHGCCVLQRCIDHASTHQRIQLVDEITFNAFTLVQDPYGNYVVQHILDLDDNQISNAVIRQFAGNVCALSVQRFSSNVIEKCIRVAERNTRKMLIEELLSRSCLEKLLRDSYGNYCVQTALDYAEPAQRALLVEGIRPILPLIWNTPYGKRIQNKLQGERKARFGGYHNQQAVINLGLVQNPGRVFQGNPLAGVYGIQNGLYSLHSQSYGQAPSASQMHSLQPQSINGYVLQGGSGHGHGVSPSYSRDFSSASFTRIGHLGGSASHSTFSDAYQWNLKPLCIKFDN